MSVVSFFLFFFKVRAILTDILGKEFIVSIKNEIWFYFNGFGAIQSACIYCLNACYTPISIATYDDVFNIFPLKNVPVF